MSGDRAWSAHFRGVNMRPILPPDLDGQFLVSPDALPADMFAGGAHAGLDAPMPSLALRVYPEVRVAKVADASGREIGALLGRPVDWRGRKTVKDVLRLPEDAPDVSGIDGFIERHVLSLAGSFVFILDMPGARRVYLDVCGTMPAVFDAEKRLAGATAPAVLGEEAIGPRFDEEAYRFLSIEKEGWFAAGLTAHAGLERLIANHYLDLDTFAQQRHWPLKQIEITTDPEAACRRIATASRAVIDAVMDAGQTAQCLTAGSETRLLLSLVKDIAQNIEFLTVDVPVADLDIARAKALSERFGLSLRILPYVEATEAERDVWLARAGYAIGGANLWQHPSVRPLDDYECLIGGSGGETGRGFFWRPGDTADTVIDAEGLVPRFGMPTHPKMRDAVAKWLEGVAGFDPFLQLDLAYLELRMSCGPFAQGYSSPKHHNIHPLISRECFEAMLTLPMDWRRDNRMVLGTVRQFWPELLEQPINRYGDWRDQARLVKRALQDPSLIVKKLRKRFG